MAEELRYLQEELWRAKRYINRLERRTANMQKKVVKESEDDRIDRLKRELKETYPDIEFTPRTLRLLRLVGTQPYVPLGHGKEAVAEAIAEHYE